MDLEANRQYCVVFGDYMYHHGGGSREEQGRGAPTDQWGDVRERVLNEGGAEWLLGELESYRYSFNMEEEVADMMMRKMMSGMVLHLQGNKSLFGVEK
jgi:hypothetical protein